MYHVNACTNIFFVWQLRCSRVRSRSKGLENWFRLRELQLSRWEFPLRRNQFDICWRGFANEFVAVKYLNFKHFSLVLIRIALCGEQAKSPNWRSFRQFSHSLRAETEVCASAGIMRPAASSSRQWGHSSGVVLIRTRGPRRTSPETPFRLDRSLEFARVVTAGLSLLRVSFEIFIDFWDFVLLTKELLFLRLKALTKFQGSKGHYLLTFRLVTPRKKWTVRTWALVSTADVCTKRRSSFKW